MSRLLEGLDNLSQQPKRVKPEDCCSFCGCAHPGNLAVGPRVQICEQCSILAMGMFLVVLRDGLSMSKEYREIYRRASQEYFRLEGVVPKEWRQ